MQNDWKQWFVFTKRDRNAAFILLSIIALVILLPYVLPEKKTEIHIDDHLQKELDAYRQNSPQTKTLSFYSAAGDTPVNSTVAKRLFYFDPNTLSEQGFVQLGLPPKTIHTLINYRNKGGYFRTPEDIRKIYGLSKTDADRLMPYIQIASDKKSKEESKYVETVSGKSSSHQYKKININTATAEDWKAFPGIGEVLANRIIKFRTSIGGFKYVDEVAKTYGLNDSTFQLIKPYLFLSDSAKAN